MVMVIFVCAILTVASAFPGSPRHIKGVQITNEGRDRLWIEMTNEDSFVLPAGQMASIILEDTWSGKILARNEECQFKKCNISHTAAELKFGGETKEDRYRVSVMEGYNKPIKIKPTGANNFCKPSECRANLIKDCPTSHQIINEDNKVVACRYSPDIRQKLCPQTAVLDTDMEVYICKTSDTYFISIG